MLGAQSRGRLRPSGQTTAGLVNHLTDPIPIDTTAFPKFTHCLDPVRIGFLESIIAKDDTYASGAGPHPAGARLMALS
jgi:hypothetical protein